jgi:uncharacterized membrane protein
MMHYSDEWHPVPQPSEISKTEREDAMGAYLMMFAALGAGLPLPMINLIASVIYYYLNRQKSRFVRFHALQSLWSQLPVTLMNGFLVIWSIRLFILQGYLDQHFWVLILAALVINLIYIGFSLYAAAMAHKGRMYYFVFFGRLAYTQVFRSGAGADSPEFPENHPPR